MNKIEFDKKLRDVQIDIDKIISLKGIIYSRPGGDRLEAFRDFGVKGIICGGIRKKYNSLKSWFHGSAMHHAKLRSEFIDLASYCILSVIQLDEENKENENHNKYTECSSDKCEDLRDTAEQTDS